MKTLLRTLTATLLLAGLAAGPASAMVPNQADLGGPGNVNYSQNGSTITISGWVESGADRYKLEQAAAKLDGVDRVINLVTQSN